MKLRIFAILLLCILLSGCVSPESRPEQTTASAPTQTQTEQTIADAVIRPLPDTTMEALENSMVQISFGQNDIYRKESGEIVLRMQIYTYEHFDLVDISGLKAGDTILLAGEEIPVASAERNDHGTVLINGGLDAGGFDLATDDTLTYFVHGYSDMKSWLPVGEAELTVTDSFLFLDSADPEQGTLFYDAEDLLNAVPDALFGYQPQNTTVRIENGQVAEMTRTYTP